MGSGVDFHPEARLDIDEIAEFIARDGSIDTAHRAVTRILDAIDALVPFPPIKATIAPTLLRARCASGACTIT